MTRGGKGAMTAAGCELPNKIRGIQFSKKKINALCKNWRYC